MGNAWVYWVYKRDLNIGCEGESRTGWGREFQSRDAVLGKALSPKVLSLDDRTVRVRVEEDRRVRVGRWGMRRGRHFF